MKRVPYRTMSLADCYAFRETPGEIVVRDSVSRISGERDVAE
jgi:hypothetical protein